MKKATKLRFCDWSLLYATILMCISGIQLEVNPYGERIWVWLHFSAGIIYIADIFWHLKLHNWPQTAHTHGKKHPWLGSFFLLTLITGCIATIHWLDTFSHSTIGGIHGKFGYLMIIAVMIHICHHIKFYKRKKSCPKRRD